MSEVDPFDYDDESVSVDPENKAPSKWLDRFKGEKGRSYRIALMYFDTLEESVIKNAKKAAKEAGAELDKKAVKVAVQKALAQRAEELGKAVDELEDHEKLDLSKAQFKKHKTQYLKAEGGGLFVSRLGKDGPEADRLWKKLDEPRTYYWSIALIYPVDKQGNLKPKQVMTDSELAPFRVSDGMFNTLIEKNEVIKSLSADGKSSLANCDLKLTCKNTGYQTFEVDPAGQAIWVKVPKVKEEFLPKAVALYKKMVEAKMITSAELKEKLGAAPADSGEDVAEDEDIENLIENV